MPGEARQQLLKDIALDSDATRRRSEARPGQMPENRAAAAANHRGVVPAHFDDDVVEMVLACEPLLGFAGRALDQTIVAPVGTIVAPGIARCDSAQRQAGLGAGQAVGAIEYAAQRQCGAGGAAIALALGDNDAGAAKRTGKTSAAGDQKTPAAIMHGADDSQPGKAAPDLTWTGTAGLITFSHGYSTPPDLQSRFSGLMVPESQTVQMIAMPAVHHILLVDDDQTLRDALAEQLALYDEFRISTAATASAGVKAVQAERVDLAVMDVGLPDMDGREAVKVMRRNGFKSPVIMLTGQGSDADTVLGLEAGANDYVVKPFKFAVLLARIRAHLRQYEASEDAVFQVGPYTFHPGSKLLVSEKGSKTKLTEKETAILRFLYRAGRKPIAREILLQEVWGYNSQVTTHTLETHIYRLRQKIEPDPANARLLVTDAGGYRLNP